MAWIAFALILVWILGAVGAYRVGPWYYLALPAAALILLIDLLRRRR
jgi:hypothetical protein